MKNKNILIIQNYNANKGDSSVIYAMKQSILNQDKSLTINLTSYNPVQAKKDYKLDSSEWLFDFRKIKLAKTKWRKLINLVKEALWIVYSFIWLFFYKTFDIKLWIPSFKTNTIKFYLKSDAVILPGGHFFTNFNSFPVIISHAYGILFGKWLGKKTMIYAQTIGPFFGKYKLITKKITYFVIKNTDIVTVRERYSYNKLKGNKNVFLTAESAFLLHINTNLGLKINDFAKIRKNSKRLVGITIHHIYYKHFFSKEKYINIMTEIFTEIIKKYSYNIVIIPMEYSYHAGGDRPLSIEIIKNMKYRNNIKLLDGDFNPLETASIIANCDIFVGTKTHSIVYSLNALVPTISISYQEKSTEFMDMFGVRDNVINLKELSKESFMKIFDRVQKNKKYYIKIQEKHRLDVRKKAEENNKLLLKLLQKSTPASS